MITYRSRLQHFGEWWHEWFNLPTLPWGKRLQDMMWRTHGSNFPTGHDRTKMVDFTHRTVGFQEGISMNTNNRIDSIWNTPFIITIIIPLLKYSKPAIYPDVSCGTSCGQQFLTSPGQSLTLRQCWLEEIALKGGGIYEQHLVPNTSISSKYLFFLPGCFMTLGQLDNHKT